MKLIVSPDKFDVKSVSGEIKKMNKRFNFSKYDLVIPRISSLNTNT
jgi:hypothetical protein